MQTLSIKGREEREIGNGHDVTDVLICAFTLDSVDESLPLSRFQP